MRDVLKANKVIESKDLSSVMAEQGMKHKLRLSRPEGAHVVLAKGDLQFSQFPSGVGVHCSDLKVKRRASSTTDIQPCVSFSILTHGRVDYSLGGQHYYFEAQKSPVIFVNVVTSEQVFTRHLYDNQRVRKANVSVDKSWLLSRCETPSDIKAINAIFNQKTCVYELPGDEEFSTLAEQLIYEKLTPGLTQQMMAEHIALKFIAKSLNILISDKSLQPEQYINTDSFTFKSSQIDTFDKKLESALDQLLDESMSLENVSKQLGISVSTLQRKVKANYNVTTFEYIRNKKLEKARNAIIIDDKSIGEAAYLAGNQHVANFVTAFKKHFDVTPAQLRKIHQVN